MQPQVFTKDPDSEFYIEEGCYITELSNTDADPEVSIAQARLCVGSKTRWHYLDGVSERYVILSGRGVVGVGDLSRDVSQGDVVLIPPGVKQRIINNSDEDLIFLVICSPRFHASVYIDCDPEPLLEKNA